MTWTWLTSLLGVVQKLLGYVPDAAPPAPPKTPLTPHDLGWDALGDEEPTQPEKKP